MRRDELVLRLIALDRAVHCAVLTVLGLGALAFAADPARAAALSIGGRGLPEALTGGRSLTLVGAMLLVYALAEGVEAVGLWRRRRWAEYLTFLVTASLLPLELVALFDHPSALRAAALAINLAVVVYLVLAKRLFGLRRPVSVVSQSAMQ